jgi:hypothetical protein
MLRKIGIGFLGLLVLLLLIAMCTGNGAEPEIVKETVEVEVTRLAEGAKEVTREVTVEVTRLVEVPVTVTYTPGPSPTPTITSTPTVTPTHTPSPTPFNVRGCVNLRSPSNYWNLDDEAFSEYFERYDEQCIKFYYSENLGVIATDYGWLLGLDFEPIADEITPPDSEDLDLYSTVWGILDIKESGDYELTLRRVEPFEDLKQPMENDGFYMVGPENDVSPGQWKSLWPPGTVDACYWERTNPDTGNIKANHFGQAGIYVRIYTGDLFETDDCAPWVFVRE